MRTSAFNNRETVWDTDNMSGLQKRVSILLGLDGFKTRSIASAFVDAGVELLTKERFEERHGAAAEGELASDQAGIRQRFLEVPLTGAPAETAGEETGQLFNDIVYLKHKAVSGPALRLGIHLDRYRISRPISNDSFQAIFRPQDDEDWRILGVYGSEAAAVASVNALRRFLIRLNVASEGFHIIEHILLRPVSRQDHQGVSVPADFYSFKISVLFPDWTARFQTPGFRRLTEETIQSNCPAHIFPEFHWLGLDRMQEFEGRYKSWLDLKNDDPADLEKSDGASKKLIDFLMEIGAENPGPKGDQP
ncbi:MAG: hypothetical protein IH872_06060 [Chloroflexi bacterium]|nr:hypothetical protein [Chloroflexota bacterium]